MDIYYLAGSHSSFGSDHRIKKSLFWTSLGKKRKLPYRLLLGIQGLCLGAQFCSMKWEKLVFTQDLFAHIVHMCWYLTLLLLCRCCFLDFLSSHLEGAFSTRSQSCWDFCRAWQYFKNSPSAGLLRFCKVSLHRLIYWSLQDRAHLLSPEKMCSVFIKGNFIKK